MIQLDPSFYHRAHHPLLYRGLDVATDGEKTTPTEVATGQMLLNQSFNSKRRGVAKRRI